MGQFRISAGLLALAQNTSAQIVYQFNGPNGVRITEIANPPGQKETDEERAARKARAALLKKRAAKRRAYEASQLDRGSSNTETGTLANRAPKPVVSKSPQDRVASGVVTINKQEIIARCKTLMGKHGSALVKVCVDRDLSAAKSLAGYPGDAKEIIARCKTQMSEHGWNLVKVCTDKDIQALVELSKYPKKYTSIIARCRQVMGQHGWNLVKVCADKDIGADDALSKY